MNRPWVVHYDHGVDPDPPIPQLTLPQFFDRSAARFPDRVATIFHDARLSYEQLKKQIDRFAGGLHALGIQPGDRVAIMLPNVPQFPVAFFGALRAGAVVVPTNPLYTTHELEHQLADAGVSVVITLDQFFESVQAALPATQVRAVIATGIGPALPRRIRPLYPLRRWREGIHAVKPGGIVCRFESLLRHDPLLEPVPAAPDDLAVLQYTGGTTGLSKGAMLSHRNLVANAVQAAGWQNMEAEKGESALCVTPFFHVYGLTIGMNLSICVGATMLLVPRWNAEEVARVAEKYRPAAFPGVPTMYVALTHLPDFSAKQFGSLRVCISGAAPLPPDVQRLFDEKSGVRLVEGYGLTEASPVTHCNPAWGTSRPGTIGVPFPATDALITDPDTWEPLPVGAIGEVTVRGPQVMKGYWNRPEETALVLRDGWLHTGDLGLMEEDGFFRIVDRKKDLIIAGGYNVYPREVEDVLYSHPAVKEAAVVGVPSDYRGETVKAIVVLRDGMSATSGEIIGFCRRELAAYKTPKIVEFRDVLPKSIIGKILRRELRDAAEESSTEGISLVDDEAEPHSGAVA